MGDSDLIALAAMLVAGLSALLYARHARDEARRANDIALRPLRVEIYQSMKEFAHFCSTYRTLQHVGSVNGTRDLVEHIESFKWEIPTPLTEPTIPPKKTLLVLLIGLPMSIANSRHCFSPTWGHKPLGEPDRLKVRLQVPSALRAPAAGHLKRFRRKKLCR